MQLQGNKEKVVFCFVQNLTKKVLFACLFGVLPFWKITSPTSAVLMDPESPIEHLCISLHLGVWHSYLVCLQAQVHKHFT